MHFHAWTWHYPSIFTWWWRSLLVATSKFNHLNIYMMPDTFLNPPPLHMYLMDGHVTDSSQLNQVRYFANWQFLFIYILFILLKCTKLTYCYKQGISWYKRSWKPDFSQLSQSNFFPMEYSLLSNRYKLVHFVPLLFVIINDSFHCEPISTAVKHNCSGVKNPYFWPFIPFWLLV